MSLRRVVTSALLPALLLTIAAPGAASSSLTLRVPVARSADLAVSTALANRALLFFINPFKEQLASLKEISRDFVSVQLKGSIFDLFEIPRAKLIVAVLAASLGTTTGRVLARLGLLANHHVRGTSLGIGDWLPLSLAFVATFMILAELVRSRILIIKWFPTLEARTGFLDFDQYTEAVAMLIHDYSVPLSYLAWLQSVSLPPDLRPLQEKIGGTVDNLTNSKKEVALVIQILRRASESKIAPTRLMKGTLVTSVQKLFRDSKDSHIDREIEALLENWNPADEDEKEMKQLVGDAHATLEFMRSQLRSFEKLIREKNFTGVPEPLNLLDTLEFIKRAFPKFPIFIDMDHLDPTTTVLIDRDHFLRVLQNLTSNANRELLKAKIKDRKILLRLVPSRDNENIILEVCDNGPGVPAEMQKDDRLFQRGKSGSSSSGLGLYFSRAIIKGAKGFLWLYSAGGPSPNDWTIFRISIPSGSPAPREAVRKVQAPWNRLVHPIQHQRFNRTAA